MQELEAKFFDEYKRLDALCRDMLNAERGVSEYIEQMETARAEGERLVPGWKDDYYALKHLRWLRNQIAHEAGAAGCEAGDLARLRAFHSRALKQQDPLAMLHRAKHPRRVPAGQAAAKQGGRGAAPQNAAPAYGGRQVYRGQAQFSARPRPAGQRGTGGRRGQEKSPLRVWLCAGIVAGLFLMLAVYLVMYLLPV